MESKKDLRLAEELRRIYLCAAQDLVRKNVTSPVFSASAVALLAEYESKIRELDRATAAKKPLVAVRERLEDELSAARARCELVDSSKRLMKEIIACNERLKSGSYKKFPATVDRYLDAFDAADDVLCSANEITSRPTCHVGEDTGILDEIVRGAIGGTSAGMSGKLKEAIDGRGQVTNILEGEEAIGGLLPEPPSEEPAV